MIRISLNPHGPHERGQSSKTICSANREMCSINPPNFCHCLRFYYIRDSVTLLNESVMVLASPGTQTGPFEPRISKIHHSVPDPPEGRYCKICKDWVPVNNFPSGKRRYSCNLHRWETYGKMAKRKHMAHGENKILFNLWIKAYSDSKRFSPVWEKEINQPGSSKVAMRVQISHKEIKQLLECMVHSFNITSNLNRNLSEIAEDTTMVPISPTEIVSIANIAFVPSFIKRKLLRAFRLEGIEGYRRVFNIAAVQPNVVFKPSSEQICTIQETLVSTNKTLIPEV